MSRWGQSSRRRGSTPRGGAPERGPSRSGTESAVPEVTGRPYRARRRAHTIGFVVQRSDGPVVTASGGEGRRTALASSRAQTAGLLVQRAAFEATRGVASRRGGVARAARWAFSRAQTAGLLMQRSRASLSAGADHTQRPSSDASARRPSGAFSAFREAGSALPNGAQPATSVVSSMSFAFIQITSPGKHASAARNLSVRWVEPVRYGHFYPAGPSAITRAA